MKLIYDTGGKYTLDDSILALTEKAVQRVGQWSKEEAWIPSLEIYVPFTRCISAMEERQGMHPTGQVIIKVKIDTDVDDSAVETLARGLHGQWPPTNKIKVDLGCYNEEGWESMIDRQDLRELPEVYFNNNFLCVTAEPVSIPDKTMGHLREVEPAHWKILAEKLYDFLNDDSFDEEAALLRAEMEVKGCDYRIERYERGERLRQVSADFIENKVKLEELVKAIKTIP